MRKLIITAALCVPFALAASGTVSAQQSGYTIRGTIPNDAPKAYLVHRVGSDVIVDSADVVNHRFEFSGQTQEPFAAMLTFEYDPRVFFTQRGANTLQFYVESSEINVEIIDPIQESIVTGSAINDDAKRWVEYIQDLSAEMAANIKTYEVLPETERTREKLEQVNEVHMRLRGKLFERAQLFIEENPNSWFALANLYETVVEGQSEERTQAVLNSFTDEVRNSPLGKRYQSRIDAIANVKIGGMAPDFTQNDVEENPVSLSDFRGKWVLIDFWASWCGPCRRENPHVVAAYEQFKDKGFTVLGVSLDSDRGAWLKAISDDKLTWTQVSDLKGWNNEAAKLYNAESIPTNFLIDPQGVIVAKNLRGDALTETLSKHME